MASKRFRNAIGIDPERVVSSAVQAALGETQPRGKKHHPGRVLAAGAALAAAAAVGQKRMPRMAKVPLRMGLHKLGKRVDGAAGGLRDRFAGHEDEPLDDGYYDDDEPEEFDDEPRAEDEDEDFDEEDFDDEDEGFEDDDQGFEDDDEDQDEDQDEDLDDEPRADEEPDDEDEPRADEEPDDEDEDLDDEDEDGFDDEPEDDDGPRGDGEELDDEELEDEPEPDLESEPEDEEPDETEPEAVEDDEDAERGQDDDQIAARSVDLGVPVTAGPRVRRERAPDLFNALGSRRRRPPVMRRGSARVDPAARPPAPDASRSGDQRRAHPKSKATSK